MLKQQFGLERTRGHWKAPDIYMLDHWHQLTVNAATVVISMEGKNLPKKDHECSPLALPLLHAKRQPRIKSTILVFFFGIIA
jgi:hypothetical protein